VFPEARVRIFGVERINQQRITGLDRPFYNFILQPRWADHLGWQPSLFRGLKNSPAHRCTLLCKVLAVNSNFYSEVLKSIPQVRGVDLDAQTRCAHYRTQRDIVAIKMKCCGVYYACKDCHAALAGHPIQVWPQSEWDAPAVLCGSCGTELSINRYLQCGSQCPVCGAAFNPGCRSHYHFYFENSCA
jgi:uncharacterized CHY-type Zn-finger protein